MKHERFLKRLSVLEARFGRDACWPYPAKPGKYGYCRVNGTKGENGKWTTIHVHRLAYILLRGPVPNELVMDHKCRHRWCANPWHVEPETEQINILLGESPAAQNAKKTHCPYGHPYDGENTAIYAGSRVCRQCSRDKASEYYQNNKAVCNDAQRRRRHLKRFGVPLPLAAE